MLSPEAGRRTGDAMQGGGRSAGTLAVAATSSGSTPSMRSSIVLSSMPMRRSKAIPWPSDSGAAQCGQRSRAAVSAPSAVRHSTRGSPSTVTVSMPGATSRDCATAHQYPRKMGLRAHSSVCLTPSWSTVLERRAQHLNSRQFLQDGEPIHGPCRQVITSPVVIW